MPEPPWYTIVKAAKYLGVAPWDLVQQPVYWLDAALLTAKIDGEVQDYQQRVSGWRANKRNARR